MDDIDVTSGMGMPAPSDQVVQRELLTVAEAAIVLGIGRTLAYELVRRYVESGGVEGIPVIRIGRCWRVPRTELFERIHSGRIDPSSGLVPDELAPRRQSSAEAAGGPGSAGRRLTIRRGGPAAGGRRSLPEPPEQLPLFPAG